MQNMLIDLYSMSITDAERLRIPYYIDISVGTGTGLEKSIVAPTWNLVSQLRRGKITAAEYEKQYRELLDASFEAGRIKSLLDYALRRAHYEFQPNQPARLFIACHCRGTQFCHRHVLGKYLDEHFPGVTYKGEYDGEDDN